MVKFTTEEERKTFEMGAKYMQTYIRICTGFYPTGLRYENITEYLKNLCEFIQEKKDYIPNTMRETIENHKDLFQNDDRMKNIPNTGDISFKQFCEIATIE